MPAGDPPLTLRELREIHLARLKGVGPALDARLADMDLRTVLDLLQHYPRRWVDRTKRVGISDLDVGDEATVIGEVISVHGRRTRNRRALVEVVIDDGSSRLYVTFFNQAWREKQLAVGTEVSLFGKLDVYRGKRQMTMPVVDVLGRAGVADDKTGVILPVYPQSGKAEVFTWQLRALVGEALTKCRARGFADPVDADLLHAHDLIDRTVAMRAIHRPESMGEMRAAERRLKFDEFLRMQVGLVARKRALAAQESGIRHVVDAADATLVTKLLDQLPFVLTADQEQAIAEITHDMAGAAPMHRLLQGDVGSGKTIVAVQAALVALDNGYQAALMAPTEILATQHYLYIKELLKPLPVDVDLLISARKAGEKAKLKRRIAEGACGLVVGTHALIEEDVEFARLGLVIVDEQHRFGVLQRQELIRKGLAPDVLVMTATPIPRTLALTIYGDLDFSVMDELPPHRTPVDTLVLDENERSRAFEFIRAKAREGGQAYVVYPVIEESTKADLRPAVRMYEEIRRNVFPELPVGLLHGRLASEEKEAVMRDFKAGRIRVLVSTTVIEVGVDVPNATAMMIEHAERFGLAQLHQLRGRIGRGRGKSLCFLVMGGGTNAAAADRLKALAATSDGFQIAEMDLKLRGPGEFFGTKQWGIPTFRIANILRDQEILEWAKREATRFIERPASKEEFEAYLRFLRQDWPRRYGLASVA